SPNLPPFAAGLGSEPGTLTSPYAPHSPAFPIPFESIEGGVFPCPRTKRPLALPSSLAEHGVLVTALSSPFISFRSPYDGSFYSLSLSEWRAKNEIVREGKKFILPDSLPPIVLETNAITKPCRVDLPVDPKVVETGAATIRVPADHWIPGREFYLEFEVESQSDPITVDLHLPEDLGEFTLPEARKRDLNGAERTGKGPFEKSERFAIAATQWKSGAELICPETERAFLLPSPLPLLFGDIIGGKAGKICSPFDASHVIDVPSDDWVKDEEIEIVDPKASEEAFRRFLLPKERPEWIEDAVLVPRYPGWVQSPYGSKRRVEVNSEDWKADALVACPETGRRFRIPLAKTAPPLELDSAIVSHALEFPQDDESALVAVLSKQFPDLKTRAVTSAFKRHDLDSEEKRRNALPIAEIIPDRCRTSGWVKPMPGEEPFEVVATSWRPGLKLETESGKPFRLPESLEPLLGSAPAAGMTCSPYLAEASEQPIEPSSDWWKDDTLQKCAESGLEFRLPPSRKRPKWKPEGEAASPSELVPGKPPKARSPHGSEAWQEVAADKWEEGKEITCHETGAPFYLPTDLPPLPADPESVEGNSIR
ncbi:MAG: hypothetical protein AAGC68_16595, partial [Verrucomicrobiota bacterium]